MAQLRIKGKLGMASGVKIFNIFMQLACKLQLVMLIFETFNFNIITKKNIAKTALCFLLSISFFLFLSFRLLL